MWDMVFAILAEISSIGIYYRSGIIQNTSLFFFINRNNHHHIIFFGIDLHSLNGRAWNGFRTFIPGFILTRTEIRGIKNFLEAKYLYTFFACFFN